MFTLCLLASKFRFIVYDRGHQVEDESDLRSRLRIQFQKSEMSLTVSLIYYVSKNYAYPFWHQAHLSLDELGIVTAFQLTRKDASEIWYLRV